MQRIVESLASAYQPDAIFLFGSQDRGMSGPDSDIDLWWSLMMRLIEVVVDPNANKFGHIRRINGLLRLSTPELVTPLELVQENL